jgi:hypothetical protein
MGKQYTILAGTFVEPDSQRKGVGETIELDDDVAQAHAARLAPVEAAAPAAAPVQTPAPAPTPRAIKADA